MQRLILLCMSHISTNPAATTYTDPGRTCVDQIEGDITSQISQNTPNMMTVGAQTVLYRCADSAGNNAAAQPRFVVVFDSVDPVLYHFGVGNAV